MPKHLLSKAISSSCWCIIHLSTVNQVLFDLFRHDLRLWKAYSITIQVSIWSYVLAGAPIFLHGLTVPLSCAMLLGTHTICWIPWFAWRIRRKAFDCWWRRKMRQLNVWNSWIGSVEIFWMKRCHFSLFLTWHQAKRSLFQKWGIDSTDFRHTWQKRTECAFT